LGCAVRGFRLMPGAVRSEVAKEIWPQAQVTRTVGQRIGR